MFEKENSLLLSGGRNDKIQMIYNDIYFLTLDTLTWIRIENQKGFGQIGLADHLLAQCTSTDFIVLGGVDSTYQLSNKISIIAFSEDRLWAYSHNSKATFEGGSPKSRHKDPGSPARLLSMASPSFL